MEKIDLRDYLPVGFVQDFFSNKNLLVVTTKGDVLKEIPLPSSAILVSFPDRNFRIKREKAGIGNSLYDISFTGFQDSLLKKNHRISRVTIRKIVIRKRSIGVFISTNEILPEKLIGSWLSLPRQALETTGNLYFFSVKDREIKDAKGNPIGIITGYLETSAHGIFSVKLAIPPHEGKVIMIPLVEEYIQIRYEENHPHKIKDIIAKSWEYFLET